MLWQVYTNTRNFQGHSLLLKKILFIFQITTGAVVRRCSVKKVFLKISQNSQENTCASHNYGNRSFCKSCKNIKFVHLLAISNIVRTQVPHYWPMSLTGFHSERFSCSFFLKWLAVDQYLYNWISQISYIASKASPIF